MYAFGFVSQPDSGVVGHEGGKQAGSLQDNQRFECASCLISVVCYRVFN